MAGRNRLLEIANFFATPAQMLGLTSGGNNALHYHHNGWLFPFATYVTYAQPFNATAFPYGGTFDQAITFLTLGMAVYVGTAHSSSNYWTITIKRRDGVVANDAVIVALDTKTCTIANSMNYISTSSFSIGSVSGNGYLFIQCDKTGTPSDLYLPCPALRCK